MSRRYTWEGPSAAGTHTVQVADARDAAGNASPDAPQAGVTVQPVPQDTQPPTVSQFAATSMQPGRLAVSFQTDEPLATLRVARGVGGADLVLGAFSRTGAGPYLYSADVPTEAGTYTVRVMAAEDAAGNAAVYSGAREAQVSAQPGPEAVAAYSSGPARPDPVIYGQRLPDPVVVDEVMRFVEGFQSLDPLVRGFLGAGMGLFKEDGRWKGEVDDWTVRGTMRIFELLIAKIRVSLGSHVFSNGGGKLESVEPLGGGIFRCKFESDDGLQPVGEGDLIESLEKSRPKAGRTEGFVRRLSRMTVVSLDAGATYADCRLDQGTAPPQAGWEYAQLGNETNPARQGLVFITAMEEGPCVQIRDGISSWALRDSASTLRVVLGRLNVLGFYAGGPDVYGLAGGDFSAAWFALTAAGLEFRRGAEQEAAGYYRGDKLRLGRGDSYFEVDLEAGTVDLVVDGEGVGGAVASLRVAVYGDPEDPQSTGLQGAVAALETALTDPVTGVQTALSEVRSEVFQDFRNGQETLRGAATRINAQVNDPDTGLVQAQATLEQRVTEQGARLVLGTDAFGNAAFIVLESGQVTGTITIGADLLAIQALTEFAPPGTLLSPLLPRAWRLPDPPDGATLVASGTGVRLTAGPTPTAAYLVQRPPNVGVPVRVVGAVSPDSSPGATVTFQWFAGNDAPILGHTTAVQTGPGPFDQRFVPPTSATYYVVSMSVGAGESITLSALRAGPTTEMGDLPFVLVDPATGKVAATAISAQSLSAVRLIARVAEIEEGRIGNVQFTGTVDLGSGRAITFDAENRQIVLTDEATGDSFAIGIIDFGQATPTALATDPGLSSLGGVTQQAEFESDALTPAETFSGSARGQARAGETYSLTFRAGCTAEATGPDASARADLTVTLRYLDAAGAVLTGSPDYVKVHEESVVANVDPGVLDKAVRLELPAAPAGAATVEVVVYRSAGADAPRGAGGLGSEPNDAHATASVADLSLTRLPTSLDFMSPAGISLTNDQNGQAFVRRSDAAVGGERLFVGGAEYRDTGDGVLRRVA